MTNLTTDFILCMLIPHRKRYLLLPKASIAEVIPMPLTTKETQSSSHYIGKYQWKSYPLTILDLEYLIEKKSDQEEWLVNYAYFMAPIITSLKPML